MGPIAWLIFGGLAGWLASKLVGKDGSMGLLANIIVGIVGSFIGGFIGSFLGFGPVSGFNIRSMAVAIMGAVILLLVVGKMKK